MVTVISHFWVIVNQLGMQMSSAPEDSCRKYFLANYCSSKCLGQVRRLRNRSRARGILGQAGTCPKMFVSIMSSGTSITIQLGRRRQSHKIMRSHCGAAKIKEETTLLLHGLWRGREVATAAASEAKQPLGGASGSIQLGRDHCVTSWKLNQ